MKTKRIKIITKIDKPHMTFEILSVFHKYDVEIIWMEVYTHVIYIKMPLIDAELWETFKAEFEHIEGYGSVKEIDLIAFEERDIEINKVLDIISHGVIVLSKDGRVKYANKYASEKIFRFGDNEITGRDITSLVNNESLATFLKMPENMISITNKEIIIQNQSYVLNVNPLISKDNIFSGYILSLDDIKKINELINANRYGNPIAFEDIIAESNKMLETINQAKLFSLSDSPVLITGESGTGKELFTRSIHNSSKRSNKPFVAINCASIPEQLLESELFGYEEGSFTGSKKGGKSGLFEIANGGTIFLDEIGEMAPHIQAKLLRVLQEKKIRRIGSHKETPIDVRVLSATNQDIEEMINSRKFRLDLLYRINIFSIHIPPLRERKSDLPALIQYFIRLHSIRYNKDIDEIDSKVMKKLINHNWPGNVRELQNVLERAVALSKHNKVLEKDIVLNYRSNNEEFIVSNSLKKSLENLEKKMIIDGLKTHNSIRAAAKGLDATHTMILNRMKKYNIKKDI